MKKVLGTAFALGLPALMAVAGIPVNEAPLQFQGPLKMQKSPKLTSVRPATAGTNAFFEGFEDRPEGITMSAREWLPAGWQDVSKAGHSSSDEGHNLTWQVLDEDSKQAIGPVVSSSAFEGYCFAYIMADVAYNDHVDLEVQDEWLITPSMTPGSEDWFYFKLWFNPGWTVYNREANDFTGQNNSLEVYVSEDDGATWTKAWSLIDDYIKTKYSDSQLRGYLINTDPGYSSIYVNIHKYEGKALKFAFRYFGNKGLPMAIDNVSLGLPTPDASFDIPYCAWRQGVSPRIDYPANPQLYIPYDTEITWANTSKEYLNNEWAYTAADGSEAKSTLKDLTTPGYAYNSVVSTPALTSFFESNVTDPFQTGFKTMKVGGILSGKDSEGVYDGEFGVGYYDITEEGHRIAQSSFVAFSPSIDLEWERVQGVPDGSIDVDALCNMYFYGGTPYGFDFIEVPVLVKQKFDDDAKMIARVYAVSDDGTITGEIGNSVVYGKDMPEANASAYSSIRFDFDVPVYVNCNIMVLLTNPCRNEEGESVYEGDIRFPYIVSKSRYGNSLMYIWTNTSELGWMESYVNLNQLPLNNNGFFGGTLMNLGVSYSSMELVDAPSIVMPAEGGTASFKLKAHHAPERWALTFDGINPAPGMSFDAVYDAASECYNVTLTAAENTTAPIKGGKLYLVSPGSVVSLDFEQEAGIGSINASDATGAKVFATADAIVVEGANSLVQVYNAAGALVAQAPANGGRTTIATTGLNKGVYIVNVDGVKAVKVVK